MLMISLFFCSNMDKYKDTTPLEDEFHDFTPRNSLLDSPKAPSSLLSTPTEDADPLLDEKVTGFKVKLDKNYSKKELHSL